VIRQSQTELFASSRQGILVPWNSLAAQSLIERCNARTSHGYETPVTSRKDFMLNTRDMPRRRDTSGHPPNLETVVTSLRKVMLYARDIPHRCDTEVISANALWR